MNKCFLHIILCWLAFTRGSEYTDRQTKAEDPISEIRHLLPVTDLSNITSTNITVQTGSTAFLPCKFRHLADHQVSWFRRHDWHILTTGVRTYTNDNRFVVLHPPDSDVWTLQLKYAQLKDAGIYECQLSTGTGAISQFVKLDVVEPRVRILGGTEYHVQLGSAIKLVCIIDETPTPPKYVFWYRNRKMVNHDTTRGGINVSNVFEKETQSFLTIKNATAEDSGNYSCAPPNTKAAHTNVFVSLGDKMAAILRRKSSTGSALSLNRDLSVICVLSTLTASTDAFIGIVFTLIPHWIINLRRLILTHR